MVATLHAGLDWFNRFGAMRTAEGEPQQRFSYIAGNSALDNGAGDDALSGCETELLALKEAGCYADFTFPSLGSPAQPRKVNTIYYATEDGKAKSYDSGESVVVGGQASGDLLLFQGPVAVDWREGCLEDGALEDTSPPHPHRLPAWLKANVHIPGRPEWLFIKLNTHGMQNRASFLSDEHDAQMRAMEHWWTQPPFRLHYVTAREAYNIVKAAEAGRSGNPNDYRDYLIPPPANRKVLCSAPWRLLSYDPERIHLQVEKAGPSRLEFAEGDLRTLAGRMHEVEIHYQNGVAVAVRVEGEGPCEAIGRQGQPFKLPNLVNALTPCHQNAFGEQSDRQATPTPIGATRGEPG
jgi:hypothetical protein